MSASEQLKGLEGRRQWTEGFARSKADAILYDALPQIVAVVEAAEDFTNSPLSRGFATSSAPIRAALTALERVLDGE